MQPPGQLISSGRVYARTASSGTMTDSNLEERLLEIGVSMIFQHLEGTALGSVEIDGVSALFLLVEASATEGSSMEATSMMGT